MINLFPSDYFSTIFYPNQLTPSIKNNNFDKTKITLIKQKLYTE